MQYLQTDILPENPGTRQAPERLEGWYERGAENSAIHVKSTTQNANFSGSVQVVQNKSISTGLVEVGTSLTENESSLEDYFELSRDQLRQLADQQNYLRDIKGELISSKLARSKLFGTCIFSRSSLTLGY